MFSAKVVPKLKSNFGTNNKALVCKGLSKIKNSFLLDLVPKLKTQTNP